jgi:hypothetical protein
VSRVARPLLARAGQAMCVLRVPGHVAFGPVATDSKKFRFLFLGLFQLNQILKIHIYLNIYPKNHNFNLHPGKILNRSVACNLDKF